MSKNAKNWLATRDIDGHYHFVAVENRETGLEAMFTNPEAVALVRGADESEAIKHFTEQKLKANRETLKLAKAFERRSEHDAELRAKDGQLL